MITSKKILGLLFSLAFLFVFPSSKVKALDLVFPFPTGNVYIINGYEGSDTHQGVSKFSLDFRTYQKSDPCFSYGAPVLSAEAGQVSFIRQVPKDNKKGYGTYLIIKNDDGKKTWYGHMIYKSITVQGPTDNNKNIIGDNVLKGQILGLLGDTGHTEGRPCNAFDGPSFGHHLHFEMRDSNGKAFKPEPMVGEKNYTNLSKTGNPYISTTVMIDLGKFWESWKDKVPYKLSYTPIKVGGKEETIGSNKIDVNEEGVLARFWEFILKFVSRKKTWTNEEALEYVKQAKGEYSDDFLKWVGWEINHELFDTASSPSSSSLIFGSHYLLKESIPDIEKIRTVLDSHEIKLLEMSRLPQAYITAFLPSDDELGDGTYSCPIPEEISNSLKKIAGYKNHFEFMEKLWNSPLPPSLKFYVQERIDFIIRLAGYYFKNEDAACRLSDQGIVSSTLRENYKRIPFDKLQKIYQQYFSKNR